MLILNKHVFLGSHLKMGQKKSYMKNEQIQNKQQEQENRLSIYFFEMIAFLKCCSQNTNTNTETDSSDSKKTMERNENDSNEVKEEDNDNDDSVEKAVRGNFRALFLNKRIVKLCVH